jgi:hypothetical protein
LHTWLYFVNNISVVTGFACIAWEHVRNLQTFDSGTSEENTEWLGPASLTLFSA